jgi:hypothetical protein
MCECLKYAQNPITVLQICKIESLALYWSILLVAYHMNNNTRQGVLSDISSKKGSNGQYYQIMNQEPFVKILDIF